jgi:pSer/pThr/pTyr-binding forkhead associated (FHA) protein
VIKRFEATPSGRLAVLAAPSGLDVGAQLPLRAGVTRLGASLENDLAFTHDPAISRVHASLREAAEGGQRHWELMDLGSANGTQVWNQALNQFENISRPALIKNGDRFQCGQTTLQLVSF